ncbi:unnamed protein product [Linum tenue]|uniref:Uncharacterized protein n=1 Tax=Linum tenue TaxID=586396 RepID=A0AAV0LIV4_9ROSI|nr:unnamed protein product [Linum tenue]
MDSRSAPASVGRSRQWSVPFFGAISRLKISGFLSKHSCMAKHM